MCMNVSHESHGLFLVVRHFSRIAPPPPASAAPIICVSNNVAQLGSPKEGPKPRQLLSLPPFPAHPLPGKSLVNVFGAPTRVTAIGWIKHYFDEILGSVVQSHFNKGLVHMECSDSDASSSQKEQQIKPLRKIKPNEVMKAGARIYLPVSVAESRISKRFDTIPSGTLHPNADEIEYLRRLVMYKWPLKFQDPAIFLLNKPPKVPLKGNLPVHNSMDVLAAAALTFDYEGAPKLVYRLDRESSGLLLFGRTKESLSHLNWLFSDTNKAKSPFKAWDDACAATCQTYWSLVIGFPKQKEGVIHAPLSKLRVDWAEALGTPIVGDDKYGWFIHWKWKQMHRKTLHLARPDGLDVQKGSVLSKVHLLHLHC